MHENDDRRRQDVGREIGVDLFQSFERGEDGNRRRDHGVSREQRRPGNAEHEMRSSCVVRAPLSERLQRQYAAFALVVGLHQEQDVFRGDDDQEGPDDEGDDADDLRRAERRFLQLAESGLQRVERARSDVAEDDADRAERQDPKAAASNGRRARPRPAESKAGRPPSKRGGTFSANLYGAGGGRIPVKTARVYTLPAALREGQVGPAGRPDLRSGDRAVRVRRQASPPRAGQQRGKSLRRFNVRARGRRPGPSRSGRL